MFHIHHICVFCLYVVFLLCIFLNFYSLLSRNDTIYYLRIYHCVSLIFLLICSILKLGVLRSSIVEFFLNSSSSPSPHSKTSNPESSPDSDSRQHCFDHFLVLRMLKTSVFSSEKFSTGLSNVRVLITMKVCSNEACQSGMFGNEFYGNGNSRKMKRKNFSN